MFFFLLLTKCGSTLSQVLSPLHCHLGSQGGRDPLEMRRMVGATYTCWKKIGRILFSAFTCPPRMSSERVWNSGDPFWDKVVSLGPSQSSPESDFKWLSLGGCGSKDDLFWEEGVEPGNLVPRRQRQAMSQQSQVSPIRLSSICQGVSRRAHTVRSRSGTEI